MPLDLVIRSQDRINGTPDEYEVLVPPGADLSPFSKYHVSSVTMKGSRYAIPANTTIQCRISKFAAAANPNQPNELIEYYDPITISKGTPSYNELGTIMANAIMTQHTQQFPSLPPLSISFTYDDTSSKYSFEILSTEYLGVGAINNYYHNFQIVVGPFIQKLGFIGNESALDDTFVIGLSGGSRPEGYRLEAQNVHSYEPFPLLYLCSDLVTNSHVVNTEPDRVLAQAMAVVNEPSYGLVGIWEPSRLEEDAQDFNVGRHIYKIKIYWRDINSDPVDFNGVDHTIALRFF